MLELALFRVDEYICLESDDPVQLMQVINASDVGNAQVTEE